MNAPGQGGVWHLPHWIFYRTNLRKKADRGDVKKVAGKIEETLQSLALGQK